MNDSEFKKLLEKSRKDKSFFHGLVFNTEATVNSADFLSEETRERILKVDPAEVIKDIAYGELADCTVTINCTFTCTVTSSFVDRLDQSVLEDCGVTINCGHTCGHTVSSQFDNRVTELASVALDRLKSK